MYYKRAIFLVRNLSYRQFSRWNVVGTVIVTGAVINLPVCISNVELNFYPKGSAPVHFCLFQISVSVTVVDPDGAPHFPCYNRDLSRYYVILSLKWFWMMKSRFYIRESLARILMCSKNSVDPDPRTQKPACPADPVHWNEWCCLNDLV
jgi:hypothetical protein